MGVQKEQQTIGNALFYDQERFSREVVTILAGAGAARELKAGMALGVVTASGKYVQFDQDAADGSENAAAILYEDATAPDGQDVKAVAIVRHAIVRQGGVVWPSDIDPGEQTTAEGQLAALDIHVR